MNVVPDSRKIYDFQKDMGKPWKSLYVEGYTKELIMDGKRYPDGKIKCPWCGRNVELKNDRIKPHIQSTKVKCVGGGQKPHPLWMDKD